MLGLTKTTFMFYDLLEGLTECSKGAVLTVKVKFGNRIQSNISKGESPGETRHKLPVVLPQ